MVEVEGEDHYEPGAEERMVAVDLCKGVLFEVQITTGRTCAKHNLGENTGFFTLHGCRNFGHAFGNTLSIKILVVSYIKCH